MIRADHARAAARLLMQHWDGGARLDKLPDVMRPGPCAEGYAIQAQWMERTTAPSRRCTRPSSLAVGAPQLIADDACANLFIRTGPPGDATRS